MSQKMLILMRHGKENRNKLSEEGVRQVFNLASQMHERVSAIDAIYHSDARRTVETAKIVADAYKNEPTLQEGMELHDNIVNTLALGNISPEAKAVCLVSHQPALLDAARLLFPKNTSPAYKAERDELLIVEFEGEEWIEALIPKTKKTIAHLIAA